MADKVQTYRSITAGAAPTALLYGELAVNIPDNRIWIGDSAGLPVELFFGAQGDFLPLTGGTLTGDLIVNEASISVVGDVTCQNLLDINTIQIDPDNNFTIGDNGLNVDYFSRYYSVDIAGYKWSLQNHHLTDVVDPLEDQDAATKIYVDTSIAAIPPGGTGDFMADGSVPMTGDLVTNGTVTSPSNGVITHLTETDFNIQIGLLRAFQVTNSLVTLGTNLEMGGHSITSLRNPVANQDAANKIYVDSSIAAIPPGSTGDFMADGSVPMTGSLGVTKIQDLTEYDLDGSGSRIELRDITLKLVLKGVSAVNCTETEVLMGKPINLNGRSITSVADPVDPQDAANKDYVDSAIAAIPPGGTGDFMADGSVPMTGDLDIGLNSIKNIKYLYSGNTGEDRLDIYAGGNMLTMLPNANIRFIDPNSVMFLTHAEADSNNPSGWEFNTSTVFSDAVSGPEPTVPEHLSTKSYVDTAIAALPPAGDLKSDGSVPMTGNLGLSRVVDLAEHASGGTGSRIEFAPTVITMVIKGLVGISINESTITIGKKISMGGNTITSLGYPVADQDATSREYVDAGDAAVMKEVNILKATLKATTDKLEALQAKVDALPKNQ